jgi:hypothetical protein
LKNREDLCDKTKHSTAEQAASIANQVIYYDYIISLNVNRVIFNPGTENTVFYELLKENGIKPEIACTLVLLSTNQY